MTILTPMLMTLILPLQSPTDEGPPDRGEAAVRIGGQAYRLEGPFTHENLSVFLVRGKAAGPPKVYLTLEEALAQKKALVHETGNVNQLTIENRGDVDIYIQAGDIVRGGKQDRTIGVDLVVAGHSGKVPVASFCVEQGRWQARGDEDVTWFEQSANSVSSRELKLAIGKSDQRSVWKSVALLQSKLADRLGEEVRSSQSATSLELTLSGQGVREAESGYTDKLREIIRNRDDTLGCVMAIGGKVSHADIYGSPALFSALWPKLLSAAAVEAISESSAESSDHAIGVREVAAFLAAAHRGEATSQDVTPRVRRAKRETTGCVLFETTDRAAGKTVLHRSYTSKRESPSRPDAGQRDQVSSPRRRQP